MKKATISDVAAKTGYSRTTISRFLNGKFEFMSEETRQRIGEVIKEIGYQPNGMARGLRLQQSSQIGVLVSDIRSPFSSILYGGITAACDKYGYSALLANTGDDPEKERFYIQKMIAQSVEGIILNSTGENIEYIRQVNENIVPIVLADRADPNTGCDIVTADSRSGIYDMMDYILAQSYGAVAMVTQHVGKNATRRLRTDVFTEYCEGQKGLAYEVIEYDSACLKGLTKQIQDFYQVHQTQKVAFFALNGVVLDELARLLLGQKLYFPQKVGLCGFDNWPWMDLVGPGLTVIEQHSFKVGQKSVVALMQRLRQKNSKPQLITVPCNLVIRRSI